MEYLAAIADLILWLFGLYDEQQATRQQCQQMWERGYVPYPLSDEEYQRIQQCRDLMQAEQDANRD